MSNYITEAFKQLNLLEDINDDVTLNASGIAELRSFLDDAAVDPDEEMPMDIFDLEAEAKDDLKKSYEGKIILECPVCHSHIFEDKENMSLTEEGEVCPDVECPYCMSNEGYYIIGEVAPYDPNRAEEIQAEYDYEEEEDLPEVEVNDDTEVEEDDIVEESLDDQEADDDEHKDEAEEKIDEGLKLDGVEELYDNEEIRGVEDLEGSEKMEGSDEIRGDKHKDPINEGCEDKVDESLWEALKDDLKEGCDSDKMDEACEKEALEEACEDKIDEGCNKVDEACDSEKLDEAIEDMSVSTEDETMVMTTKEDGGVVIETTPKEEEVEAEFSDEEMIVPVGDENQEIIDVAVDANDMEDEEDFTEVKEKSEESEDEFGFDDFDEFDEESFDNLGESYLRNCYENVNSFKTSAASIDGNKLMVEGMITFDSGNSKKTNFVFEAVKSDNGNYKFEGYNEQISRGKKTFKLSGKLEEKKFVCESLNYNYRSKNELNESIRVYGTIKRK